LRACLLQLHANIRKDPIRPAKARKAPATPVRWHTPKSTYAEKKEKLKEKLAALMKAGEEEEDDE
jgi:Ribosomal L18 C-terminal region